MEAASNFLASSTSSPFHPMAVMRSGLPSSSSSSPSVSYLQEPATLGVSSAPGNSAARTIPFSGPSRDQRNEYNALFHVMKEDTASQATLNRREKIVGDSERLLQDIEYQHSRWPGLWFPSIQSKDSRCSSLQSIATEPATVLEDELCDAVDLAKKALSASKQAASLSDSKHLATSLEATELSDHRKEEVKTVRSTRLLERQSRRRRTPKSKDLVLEVNKSKRVDAKKKLSQGYDPNDPLRLFLWGPETRQLLTIEEESELIIQIQDLLKLEHVKDSLHFQFRCEPTLVEWAEAVGVSCRVLQLQLQTGHSCREKLINANLRMVVHVAKQYQGRGLSLQDLLQEGSMGLIKSIEKFKPQAGCRFATYAYWWIRQTVRKAIFQHSRTIRLPENVYGLLNKVMEAKRSYVQEGNYRPSKEQIAKRVGITVDKLEKLMVTTRTPLSMQQPVWMDQETTFQEITADTGIEIPDVSVTKQLMRQHVRNLLGILSPKERRIIRLRFGIEDGEQKSLSEIGDIFGLSKERVRQLENRALYKLKQCLSSHGLDAYGDLLV
ncbi:RNA polymerase sigma factor sigF, chloroplastic isoform X2 [Punica granatum]|uniref:RNA polymerase sigma factor n=1 Tax=Punica granatum TaxID=22663 RepID=A0A6P8CXD5_PUNGR|nr:RNA polymerase sigma factor sigF, chloroplastic isoform X2 [Punica granatum]